MRGTSSHSDELTGDFGNKPEAILIGDHFLSCLLAEKLSLRDLRLLQQYRPKADSCTAANSIAIRSRRRRRQTTEVTTCDPKRMKVSQGAMQQFQSWQLFS